MLSEAVGSLDEQCEKQWITDSGLLSTSGATGPKALLRQWSSREATCGSTGIYWGRLAMIHLLANDISAAKASLARAPASPSQYAYVTDIAAVQIQVQERMASSAPLAREDVVKFEAAYATIVAKHPKWPTGYAMLGGMQTLLGKHAEAIKNLERAAKGDAYQLWGVYRNETISFSELEKHKEALAAADKAIELNPALLSDAPFAFAVAISHAALGYLDDASDTLKVILAKRPEVRNDPGFLRAVEYYNSQRARLPKKK
jgi:tetratricopeptide (TPR) repeat protein